MEWLVAILVAAPVYLAVPYLILRSKRRGRAGKGAALGQVLDAGFSVFDPGKARAVEVLNVHKEVGRAALGDQGEKGKVGGGRQRSCIAKRPAARLCPRSGLFGQKKDDKRSPIA